MNKSFLHRRVAAVACAAIASIAAIEKSDAAVVFIDFTVYPHQTQISYISGISFSLWDNGDIYVGIPRTESDEWGPGYLSNSTTGDYPTANILRFDFDSPASDISFLYDNYGSGSPGGGGDSFYQALDSSGTVLETGSLNGLSGSLVSLTSSNVKSVLINNTENNWQIAVQTLSADIGASAIPEPGSAFSLLALLTGSTCFVRFRQRLR